MEQLLPESEEGYKTNGDVEGEGECEDIHDGDEDEDEEGDAAVDRALATRPRLWMMMKAEGSTRGTIDR
jgi:hypothetical protein